MVERSGQTGALFVVGCAWERGAGMRIGARGGEGGWNEQERGTWSALATEKCVSGTRECVVGMEGCVFVLCGVLRVGGGSVDKACVGGEGGKEWEVCGMRGPGGGAGSAGTMHGWAEVAAPEAHQRSRLAVGGMGAGAWGTRTGVVFEKEAVLGGRTEVEGGVGLCRCCLGFPPPPPPVLLACYHCCCLLSILQHQSCLRTAAGLAQQRATAPMTACDCQGAYLLYLQRSHEVERLT